MPKVIIREFDNSTTSILQSNNFSVVVPGFAGIPQAGYNLNDILDENGCYEFTSQAEFVNYVGLVGPSYTADPVRVDLAKALKEFEEHGPGVDHYTYDSAEEASHFLLKRHETVTIVTHVEEIEIIDASGNKSKTTTNEEEKQPSYEKYGKSNIEQDDETGIYYFKSDDEKCYLYTLTKVDADLSGYEIAKFAENEVYRLVPVTKISQVFNVYNDEEYEIDYTVREDVKITRVIDLDSLGNDGVKFKHKGNQIAYELLGIGYPVLFKKLHGNYVSSEYARETQDPNFWECLKDRSMYNFRFITTGGDYAADVQNKIIDVAEFHKTGEADDKITLEDVDTFPLQNGRGDCTALCDLDEEATNNGKLILDKTTVEKTLDTVGKLAKSINSSKYAAIFAPRVMYTMSDAEADIFAKNDADRDVVRTFPASFNYLSCLAASLSKYAEWYAAAGYTRGISSRGIAATTIKFGEIANNTLAPRVLNKYVDKAVNLVVCERGTYYLGGNRTAYALNRTGLIFSHFLNIRQLCTTIKKQVYSACKQFTFDPNSDILWINFVGAIKPTLEKMKGDQGINGYLISKVKTNKKGVLLAKIRIVPIEAVEDFDISLSLEDSLTGIVVGADEALSD